MNKSRRRVTKSVRQKTVRRHQHRGGMHRGKRVVACRNWAATGSCPYGNRCRYSHASAAPAAPAASAAHVPVPVPVPMPVPMPMPMPAPLTFRAMDAAASAAASAAAVESGFSQKPNPNPNLTLKVLSALPEGVNLELRSKALVRPSSGHFKHMMEQLTQNPVLSKKQTGRVQGAMVDAGNQRLANEMAINLRESAQRLRAGSFKSRDIEACARTNARIVAELEQAIDLGSLPARADLAELLLNSDKVGMGNYEEERAYKLVATHSRDPDCAGVAALYFIDKSNLGEARKFAEYSAAKGSKYGQFALGVLEKNRRNYPAAEAQFQLAVAQNYDEAQLQLGSMYRNGHGVACKPTGRNPRFGSPFGDDDGCEPDFNEAMRLCHLAADQGNRVAFYFLGTLHRDKVGQKVSVDPDKDLREAIYWFELAVAAGNHQAEADLQNLKKKGGKRTIKRTRGGMFGSKHSAASSAAEAGSSQTPRKPNLTLKMLSALPDMDSKKALVGPDSGHFKHMMRQLTQGLSKKQTALAQGAMVDAGNHRLVNDMAIQLRESAQRLCAGSFKTRDLAACTTAIGKAVTQLERAIGLGSWSACADLAELLVNSNKVGMGHPDEERAFELVAAHAREDPDCAGVVALCFIYESNVEEAHEFAEHSAAEGSKYGQFALGLLEKRRKNYPAAVAQFQLAAAQNYDEAQLQLGSMHQRGDGVAPDLNEAMRLYHLAADQGNRDAFFLLGIMHRDAIRQKISVDPKADLKEAIYWLELAVAADQRKAETVLENLRKRPDFD